MEKEVVCSVIIFFSTPNINLCWTINKARETKSSRNRFCYQQILECNKFSSNSIYIKFFLICLPSIEPWQFWRPHVILSVHLFRYPWHTVRVTLLYVQPVEQAEHTYCLFQLFALLSTADSLLAHLLGSTLDSITKGKPSDTLVYCILITGVRHSSTTTYLRLWCIHEGQLKPFSCLILA